MRRLLLIGIGTGDPAYVTVQAIAAMNAASVFFVFDKGADKEDLTAVRTAILTRHVDATGYRMVAVESPSRDPETGYRDGVEAWHQARAERLADAIAAHLPEGATGAFLVWGDPAFYDSTLRVARRAEAVANLDLDVEVIPGISSIQILAARHKIGLNAIGEPVLVTTGRQLREHGLPPPGTSTVVMLDGDLACRDLVGRGLHIYWGAALGGPDEVLIAGPLDDVIGAIAASRAELKARQGWVMDTYLLRRLDE